MSSRSPGCFRLNFYKDLNAFEIYKSRNGDGSDGVPDCDESNYDTVMKEWIFVWGDVLVINWVSNDPHNGNDHHLLFKREGQAGRNDPNARKSPLSRNANSSRFDLVSNGQRIQFVHDQYDEAEWSFDFCWTDASGALQCIDPKGKVKNPT